MIYRHLLIAFSVASLLTASGESKDPAKAYVVSDAHLDTQWNWDVQTTIADFIPATMSRNLLLLRQYPDYIFNFEGGVKYAWMKEYYPHEYELVKDYIKDGRWHISGASWDANDVIVPSVESQIRNIMLGQNFYRKEFGVESTDIFLPDCFGFGWTLPTIASHCGLVGFSSQKLGWRYSPFYGDSKIPFQIGLWQGVDGSQIMMAHGYGYGQRWNDEDLSNDSTLLSLARQNALNTVYRYYGTGDTGGSPTIASVTSVEKGVNGSGPLKVISATSDRLYRDYLPYDKHPELPVFDGELLIDVHSTGCYTSQAAMKLYNRQNEQLGDAAERAATIAALYAGSEYPTAALTENWRRFIWHQFHDDLTGTSIPRAYEFSWNDELLTSKQFSGIIAHAASNVASTLDTRTKGEAVILFNPLAYEVRDIIELSIPAKGEPARVVAKDPDGKPVPSQIISYDGKKLTILIEATLSPVSFSVYDVETSGKGSVANSDKGIKKGVESVENSVYRISFDSNGDISSLTDKRYERELVKSGHKIRLALFPENKSYEWPAWEVLKETIDAEPMSIEKDVEITLVEDGPLRKRVKIAKRYGDSEFVQYVALYERGKADQIDFANEIDWATTNALLKAEFPLVVDNEKATYDLGIGVAERPNNSITAYEVPAQQWADLTDISGDYGVTVINDSKYGWDKPDNNTLRLTLLHTPQTATSYRYQDHQDFGHHEFTYSLIGHAGGLDRAAAVRQGERLNQKVKAFVADKHKGEGRMLSFVRTDSPNVVVKALKGAEDGDGFIVRVYETAGKATEANILFDKAPRGAKVTDGTEKNMEELAVKGNAVPVSLRANGIATVRVYFDSPFPRNRVRMASLPLPYDKRGMTWNEFRHDGDFSQGYTYAAEIVPETIEHEGIKFELSPGLEKNTLSAKGETLTFPEGEWSKLHLLAAAAREEGAIDVEYSIGGKTIRETVPSYTGFVGQWGHKGHTEGFLRPEQVAFIGTHRHSTFKDEPYEYTYMYHYVIDVPEGARSMTLPDNPELAIFAVTLSACDVRPVSDANARFKTANVSNGSERGVVENRRNILTADMISGCSGYVNEQERPEFLVDSDETTKWCDVTGVPSYVDFDLKEGRPLTGWKLVNAAEENPGYITSVCYLLGRNGLDEEWQTIDWVRGNHANVIRRKIPNPSPVRYLRLLVTSPMQDPTAGETRIYEFEAYD